MATVRPYTVPPGTKRVEYAAPRGVGRVAVALGQRLGISPAHAHQVLHTGRLIPRVVALVEAHLDVGAHDDLARRILPLEFALGRVPVEAFDAQLVLSAQRADGEEDVAELAYQLKQTDENARRLFQAKAVTVIREQRVMRALAAKHGFRE